MKRPKILDKVNDPRYISGIYNYCDRWCERCQFTERCLNYDKSEKYLKDEESQDVTNEKFWNNMHDIFKETMELIKYVSKERGIDLSNIEPDPEFEKKEKKIREYAENHELSKAAKKYIDIVEKWFKSEKKLLESKQLELNKFIAMGLNEQETINTSFNIIDAVEIIRWYQFQIYVKLMRALSNKDDLFEFEGMEEFPSDADGSTKVALIGIDRSIAAWGSFQKYFSEKSDDILDIILLLDRIRRKAEEFFPKARGFVRAGFDTGDSIVYEG